MNEPISPFQLPWFGSTWPLPPVCLPHPLQISSTGSVPVSTLIIGRSPFTKSKLLGAMDGNVSLVSSREHMLNTHEFIERMPLTFFYLLITKLK